MKPATRMMVMGDRYGKSAQRSGMNDRHYMPEHDRMEHSEREGMPHRNRERGYPGRHEEYGMREDGPNDSYGSYGGRKGKWDDKEMMVSGSAWINPGGYDDHHKQSGQSYGKMDEHKARQWVQKMQNADGTSGEHFKPEMAEQLRVAHAPDTDKWEFYAAMNMIYSDDAAVAKKFGVDKPEYYACRAKAWLEDKDAKPDKLMRYKECIVE